MVIEMIINEEMQEFFHSCTQKGNYDPLYKAYGKFIENLIENMKKVTFLDGSFSREINVRLSGIFSHVIDFDASRRGNYNFKSRFTEFLEKLEQALVSRNWNDFYWKYRNLADFMIKSARIQGVLDIRIANGSNMYQSLKDRDIALNSGTQRIDVNPIVERPRFGNVENVSSQQMHENVPSKIPEVKESVPTDTPEAYEFGFTSVPEDEGLVLAGLPEVKESVPTGTAEVYEFGFTSESEVKKPISNKTPEVEQLGSTIENEVEKVPKVFLEPKTENIQANQPEAMIQLEFIIMKIKEKVNLIQIELDRMQKPDILEENLRIMKTKQNTTQKQLEMEHAAKQSVDTSIATLKAHLMNKMELIEKHVHEQNDQFKLKEDLLNKKIVDLMIRENSLNDKMEAMMDKSGQEQREKMKLKEEALDEKNEAAKIKEEFLDRKIDAMLELMELFKQQNQLKVVATHFSENSERCTKGSHSESTDRSQVEKATEHQKTCQSASDLISSRPMPIESLLDDDEEIRQMQEKFKREEAELLRRNDAEMKALKERGRQKNEKEQGEIRELSRSVSRARERASFPQ